LENFRRKSRHIAAQRIEHRSSSRFGGSSLMAGAKRSIRELKVRAELKFAVEGRKKRRERKKKLGIARCFFADDAASVIENDAIVASFCALARLI